MAIKAGAKEVGFDDAALLSEPSAAALAYCLEEKASNGDRVVVVDFGGACVEVSISIFQHRKLVVEAKKFKAVGGMDIDETMLNQVIQRLGAKFSSSAESKSRLRLACSEAKRKLCSDGEKSTNVEADGCDPIVITLDDFNRWNEPHFEKVMSTITGAIWEKSLESSDFQHVMLVGGSSKSPQIMAQVKKHFDRDIVDKLVHFFRF